MLPKKLRVAVQLFPKQAKAVLTDDYVLIKEHPNGLNYHRLGVVIGRHILLRATDRNKLKRLIFDFLRPWLVSSSQNASQGKDLLIVLKAPIIKLDSQELKNKLREYGKFVK
jgi:ribonuclease P protein component